MVETVVTCDTCGAEERADEDLLPDGWFRVEVDDEIGEYCSTICARGGLLSTDRRPRP